MPRTFWTPSVRTSVWIGTRKRNRKKHPGRFLNLPGVLLPSLFIRLSNQKYTIVSGPKFRKRNGFSLELKALFDTFSLEKKYYGLQVPQGSYPCAMRSSLLPLYSSRFSFFIEDAPEQVGRWNFFELVLRI